MRDITLEELLEAGCHFGHQVTRQNPKARDFVFEARDGIHIIDLAKTKEYLDEALAFVKEVAQRPESSLLIVGTKRQAQEIVAEEVRNAQEGDVFSVTNRWIGGTLTNFSAVEKNFKRLHELTKLLASSDAREKYTKRELGLFERERAKLESFYSGVATMKQVPDLLFIIDTHTEYLVVAEANRMGIPVVGIVDTNADPDVISHPIPANDDAVGSIQLLTSAVLDAWMEGKTGKEVKRAKQEAKKKEVKEPTKEGEKTQSASDAAVAQADQSPKKTTKRTKTGDVK